MTCGVFFNSPLIATAGFKWTHTCTPLFGSRGCFFAFVFVSLCDLWWEWGRLCFMFSGCCELTRRPGLSKGSTRLSLTIHHHGTLRLLQHCAASNFHPVWFGDNVVNCFQVIQRIFYNVNRSWTGRITCSELRKSNFLQVHVTKITLCFFFLILCPINSLKTTV